MNSKAFALARKTLRKAVKEYGWSRYWSRDGKHYQPRRGKFEGEHWSIVYFYDAMLYGESDETFDIDGQTHDVFCITNTERAAFQLNMATDYVMLSYSDHGFVSMAELTAERYADLVREEYESEDEG